MPARIHTARHESALGSWEMVRTAPEARLAGHIRSYVGYHERSVVPGRRQRELPGPGVVLILDLGPTLRLHEGPGLRPTTHPGGFAAGPGESFTTTELDGHEQRGVQIDCTLEGAAALLGVPLAALAGRTASVDDLFGAEAARLRERLEACARTDWPARFALLDRFFLPRLAAAPSDRDPWLAWAWQRIEATGGNVTVDTLARELGYSRKHVSTRFRARFGLAPKPLARLVRFDRAVRLLRDGAGRDGAGRTETLAAVAAACGYFDQAHFIRDFRHYAGGPPGEYDVPWPVAAG